MWTATVTIKGKYHLKYFLTEDTDDKNEETTYIIT